MIAHTVEIAFCLPGGKALQDYSKEELAEGMDLELRKFDAWFRQQGNHRLIGLERAILKTYIAWKTLYAETDVDPQAGGRDHG